LPLRHSPTPESPRPKPSVIIYDCDGVLIDSRRANQAYYNYILAHFGRRPLTEEQLDLVHSATAESAVHFLFQGTPWLAQAQDFQRRLDNAPFLSLIRLEPHVREVLERLRPAYRTAIATNRGKSLAQVLNTLGLDGLFDLTVSCYEVRRPKPHPECLQKILRHFRLRPDQALYIGDSEVDRQVAREAGVPLAAYKNPSLRTPYHLRDHQELLGLLGLEGA
jgi:HAD superfamily hydrolase (TIGR01509 family)